jgi:GntR family transcriptional regulator / MocR family aminotransferase
MRVEWSSVGVDLHVDWDPARRGSMQLVEVLRSAIRAGRLAPGMRLPSTRALAADLGLARGTVTRAYEQLAVEGFVLTRHGAPTIVTDWSHAPEPPSGPSRRTVRPRWDLRPCRPDVSAFPRAQWRAASRRVLQRVSVEDLDYGDPQGHPALRTALADYLGRTRGVAATPERIVVCNGYRHALSLLCTVLADRGVPSLAIEDPSLPAFREVAHRAGLRTEPMEVDQHGARVEDVDAPAVLVTPAHQYPLGVTMHSERRRSLSERAARGAIVIEDDYDGEFRFGQPPVGALQGLAPEHVVYAGTASKTLAPALRLGWVVLPEHLVEPVRALLELTERQGSVLDQLVLAEMIVSGGYDRQVRQRRSAYLQRRRRLVAELQHHLAPPAATALPPGIEAGLHAVLPLPDGVSEADVAAAASTESIGIDVLGPHWMRSGPHPQAIIVGYAAAPDHGFAPALTALREMLDRLPPRSR